MLQHPISKFVNYSDSCPSLCSPSYYIFNYFCNLRLCVPSTASFLFHIIFVHSWGNHKWITTYCFNKGLNWFCLWPGNSITCKIITTTIFMIYFLGHEHFSYINVNAVVVKKSCYHFLYLVRENKSFVI